ncbi:MAG: TldD/PmbA family protein [Candidatus Schekmanbacteria bacterium]|nr:MAG: TldD/PmbA family protein [Candidatus Schekmanbacteria bacterium]
MIEIKRIIQPIDCDTILNRSRSGGGIFSELFFENKVFNSVTLEDGKIEEVSGGIDKGVGLRVISGDKTFYGYTNKVENSSLLDLAKEISSAVKSQKISAKELKKIDFKEEKDADFKDFLKGTLDDRVEKLKLAESFLPRGSNYLKHYKLVISDSIQEVAIINSEGKEIIDRRLNTIFIVQVVLAKDEIIQTGYEPIGGSEGFELFEKIDLGKTVKSSFERAKMMLDAPKAPAGSMPVVLSSEAGGTMIHEAVGHGFEADYAQEGLSVYSGKKGELISSTLVTVADDPTLTGKRGSYRFDDEGTASSETILIENGCLKNYLYDLLSAMKDGVVSTGNGRRESYRFKPIPRMSNTYIKPGNHSPEEILKETEKGLFVKKMGGGQVNPVNGDFVFEVSEGYLIQNGKLVSPVRGATLAGNGPKVLLDIDMVGNDLGFGIGTCGKGGQGVPVADAQPTLRIKSLVVGGEGNPPWEK